MSDNRKLVPTHHPVSMTAIRNAGSEQMSIDLGSGLRRLVRQRRIIRLLAAGAALSLSLVGQAFAQSALTSLVEISDTRPGNITITPDNRVIITQQPLDAPTLRVVELLDDGTKVPFPTQDWSDGPETGDVGIAATIGIKSDANGVVWILDMGNESSGPKIVAWDTHLDTLHKTIDIPADVITPISHGRGWQRPPLLHPDHQTLRATAAAPVRGGGPL